MKHNTKTFASRLIRGAAMALAVACAPALVAQEGGWSKHIYGVQVGYMTGLHGFGGTNVAFTGEKVFSNSYAIRGKLEYGFGDADYYTGTQAGAMLDVVCYKYTNGFVYYFAGLGYFERDVEFSGWGAGYHPYQPYAPESGMGVHLGLGHLFSRHFGAELKYAHLPADQTEFNYWQLSLLWRF
jgi:hypothetical protein